MKTRSIFLNVLILLIGATYSSNAQSSEAPAIRILPAAEEGMVKVLYAYDSDHAVDVKFFSQRGLLNTDRIKAGTFHHGFIKKYDVRLIRSKAFWVEVSSDQVSVRYKMIPSQDRKSYIPLLEKAEYTQPLAQIINF